MKKICMLLSNPFTNDNRVYREAKTLVDEGYEVVVICPKCNRDLPDEEKIDRINIKRVLSCFLPFFPLSVFEFKETRLFIRKAMQEKADVYHAHDFDTLLVGFLAAKRNRANLIYDSHEYWRDKSWSEVGVLKRILFVALTRLLERMLIKKCDAVITVSEGIANELKKSYRLKVQPEVVRNLPITKSIKRSNKLREIIKDQKIILYLGALTKDRGLEKLIQFSANLPKNVSLVFVGSGPLEKVISGAAADQKKVIVLPPVPSTEVVALSSGADIGIIPTENTSISHKFSLPNKLFDYIQAGVPVLASSLPEISKVVKEYGVGETFDFGNDSFYSAVEKILKDKKRYEKGLEKAAQVLSWENESKKLLKIYKEL